MGGVLEESDASSGAAAHKLQIARADDEQTLLAKLAHTEDQTVRCYQRAGSLELSPPHRTIIERQTVALLAARNRISELKRQPKKSA
jgi:hypothetical protein